MWAAGVLAYELLVGRPPFEVADEAETRKKIMFETTVKFPPHGEAYAGCRMCGMLDAAPSLLVRLVCQAPHKHTPPTALASTATVSHEAIAFIKAVLAKNASVRPSAADLLHHPWLRQHLVAMAARVSHLDAPSLRCVCVVSGLSGLSSRMDPPPPPTCTLICSSHPFVICPPAHSTHTARSGLCPAWWPAAATPS